VTREEITIGLAGAVEQSYASMYRAERGVTDANTAYLEAKKSLEINRQALLEHLSRP
jgi:hypothetical protein